MLTSGLMLANYENDGIVASTFLQVVLAGLAYAQCNASSRCGDYYRGGHQRGVTHLGQTGLAGLLRLRFLNLISIRGDRATIAPQPLSMP